MIITLDLPDDIAQHLASAGENLSHTALEALAIEAYREHKLSTGQLRRLLGFHTRMQVHAFLKDRGIPLHYDGEDLEHDRKAGDSLSTRPPAV